MNQARGIRQELLHQEPQAKTHTASVANTGEPTAPTAGKTTAKQTALIQLVLLICFIASSCSLGSNPILGKWSPKSEGKVVLSATDIEFTGDQMIYRDGRDPSDRIPVEYQVSGSKVTVIPQTGMFGPFACAATEGDTITCDLPVVGRTIYVRRKK